MRPLVVILAAETIKTLLLLHQCSTRWPCSFGLERPVHPLVLSVLLRVSEFDALRTNSKADPPHRELGQSTKSNWAREWNSIIASDYLGEPVALKESFENDLHRERGGREQTGAADEETTLGIQHGQRIAVWTRPKPELPFEVRRPYVIWRCSEREAGIEWPTDILAPAAPRSLNHSLASEQLADRTRRWPTDLWGSSLEHGEQLSRSPRRMLGSKGRYPLLHASGKLVGRRMWVVRAISEPLYSLAPIAGQPLMACLLTDSECNTQLGDSVSAIKSEANEFLAY